MLGHSSGDSSQCGHTHSHQPIPLSSQHGPACLGTRLTLTPGDGSVQRDEAILNTVQKVENTNKFSIYLRSFMSLCPQLSRKQILEHKGMVLMWGLLLKQPSDHNTDILSHLCLGSSFSCEAIYFAGLDIWYGLLSC